MALRRVGSAWWVWGAGLQVTPPMGLESWRAGGPSSSDTSQAQSHGFELAHPNVHPINELLEYMMGLVLQTPNYRISVAQGDNRTLQSV